MNTPEMRVHGKVTTATATAITVTSGVDTMDSKAGGAITTVVINGTALTGFKVGDPVMIRVNG